MCQSWIGGAPVSLRVCISQLGATGNPSTFRGGIWIAWNLCHPRLDADSAGVSDENTISRPIPECLAVSIGASARLQREAGRIPFA